MQNYIILFILHHFGYKNIMYLSNYILSNVIRSHSTAFDGCIYGKEHPQTSDSRSCELVEVPPAPEALAEKTDVCG